MGCYFALYMLHPYINILLHTMTQSEYKKMLTTMFVLWSVLPTFMRQAMFSSALIWFIFLYCLAGYFRLWANDFGSKNFIWLGFALMMFNIFSIVVFDFIGLKIPYIGNRASILLSGDSITTLMLTFSLLIGFSHLNIGHSKVINTIASTTLGIYFIHAYPLTYLRELFRENSLYQDSPYLIPCSIAIVLASYFMSMLVELVRIQIFKILSRGRLS